MEKQIEEMAKVIGEDIRFTITDSTDCFIKVLAVCGGLAKKLYDAGYRKQSEGEWESYYGGYRCPYCKEVFKDDMLFIMESFPEGKLPGCCPNCGARMKGGAE